MGLFYRNGLLQFGEENLCDLSAIVKRQNGEPFYLYDLDAIKTRVRALREAYSGIHIHYAMKANSCESVLRALQQLDTGVDVVSGGEIKRAVKVGFAPEKIIFSGVGKSRAELELAISMGIRQINVESPEELDRIIEMSIAMKKHPKLAFRINPDVDAKTHPYITTGFRENKFGMGEYFVEELRAKMKAAKGAVTLQGLTMHIGSQLQDIKPLEDAIQKTRALLEIFQSDGHDMRTIDVGGGLGIPYTEEHQNPSRDLSLLQAYGSMLKKALAGFQGEVLCEPGRILVGSSGVLVGEVQYVKETPHRNFLILNTGIHHLMRPALYQAYHRILPLQQNQNREKKTYDIVGPICESSDVIGKNRELTKVQAGESLAIADSGAYGFTMASLYNEHALPAQFLWENGKLREENEN